MFELRLQHVYDGDSLQSNLEGAFVVLLRCPPQPGSALKSLRNGSLIAAAGTACAAVNSLHNNLRTGTLFVDPYWVSFYVTNYRDGFRRRALVGTLCRVIAPHGISVIAINVVAFLAACSLAWLLIRSFTRLTALSNAASLFTFGFFASIFAGMFFDTLGDTLQLTFGLFLAGCFAANAWKAGPRFRLLLGLILVLTGSFIHEASVFFLVPVLPFFIRPRPRFSDFILPSLVLVALTGLSLHWSSLQPRLTYAAVSFPHKAFFAGVDATPNFKSLLQTEAGFDFGSLHNMLRFASKCLRLGVLLFVGLLAVSKCLPRQLFGHFLWPLACVLVYNMPLWFIAHDWGRFLCYAFFFAMVATSFWRADELAPGESKLRAIPVVARAVHEAGTNELISLTALFVLLTSQTLFSRITGISVRTLVSFLLIVTFAVFYFRLKQKLPAERLV